MEKPAYNFCKNCKYYKFISLTSVCTNPYAVREGSELIKETNYPLCSHERTDYGICGVLAKLYEEK